MGVHPVLAAFALGGLWIFGVVILIDYAARDEAEWMPHSSVLERRTRMISAIALAMITFDLADLLILW